MPTCSQCRRRIWFWQANLFGGPCTHCRAEEAAALAVAARTRNAARRSAFEQSGGLRRAWLGARRGALLGTFGLVAVGASLFALTGEPGARYPFPRLAIGWGLVTLGAVLVAGFVGWWLSSWLIGVGCLVGVGVAGGAIIGGYQGLRGRWELFA